MKILVIGPCGAGKSTLSKRLGKKYMVPVYHMDAYYMNPDWSKRNFECFLKDHDEIINTPSWIIDGNGRKTLEERWKRADFVIVCKPPLLSCYYGVIKRAVTTIGKEKTDGPQGAKNSISYNLLKWTWEFERKYAPVIEQYSRKYPTVRVITLASLREIYAFSCLDQSPK